jgi:beta-lactamase class A
MRFGLLFLLFAAPAIAQRPLQQQIENIAWEAHGKVAVACSLPGTALTCDLRPGDHPPMQSVFKLPLVLAILHQVELGRFSLDQPISFQKRDLIHPKPYSPLQDRYPNAGVEVPLRELLELTVGRSDNTAADMLLRLAGGEKVVAEYVASLGVTGFELRDNERALHRDHRLQYRNWFEPRGAVQLLRIISDRSPLTAEHTALLLHWMSDTASPLGSGLPSGTSVPHKTGHSDTENGVTAATNDIALIALPDGRRIALAVFLTDSTSDEATRQRVLAEIGKAVYEFATRDH